MKAMVIDAFGGAEAMYMTDIATPVPGPGEVLIRIRATSVNPVEWKIRDGHLARLFPCKFPLILGWDAAGTIAAQTAQSVVLRQAYFTAGSKTLTIPVQAGDLIIVGWSVSNSPATTTCSGLLKFTATQVPWTS